jgi:hypothetical protein
MSAGAVRAAAAAAAAVAAAALFLASAACHSNEVVQGDAPAAVAPSTQVAPKPPPVDHLAPGELLEGTSQAFGVTLPRDLDVAHSFPSVVYAFGPLTVHPVVQYLRARLNGGTLREGPYSATFEHVTAPGKPAVDLAVHVVVALGGVSVELRDTTPVALPGFADDAARWKRVGLTASGKLADPTHLD